MNVPTYSMSPAGPFDLATQVAHFGEWQVTGDGRIVIAFAVDATWEPVAVALRQDDHGVVHGTVHVQAGVAGDDLARRAWAQALECLSLDIDATGWAAVGAADDVIGQLQPRYGFLRPVLFHSPYESASKFVMGHRISMKQADALRARMCRELGAALDLHGETFYAFPAPGELARLEAFQGLSELKVERLRAVAQAATEGLLDRAKLRELGPAAAVQRVQQLPGVGPFFAQGIVYRGVGVVDEITTDSLTLHAVQVAYKLGAGEVDGALGEISARWAPFRMWAVVLLHVWLRREVGLPTRAKRFAGKR